tara:strand:+ start:52 stop:330 length:279 start_codon:yes stop_codon:yes gene_type:complete
MGSIIRTISLDGRTLKIAESIPNFSQWVRAKLLELEESRVTPKQGWKYYCIECGWTAVYPRVRTWLYCKNMDDGHCKNYDELSHTGSLVDLE